MSTPALPSFDVLVKSHQKPKLPPFSELKPVKKSEIKADKPAVIMGYPEPKPEPQEQVQLKKEYPKKVKIKTPKRAKLASELLAFKQKYSIPGHALTYRYVRVTDDRNNFLPAPKGGAAMLIAVDKTCLTLSFAVCSEEDSFIFDEARKICQDRFAKGFAFRIDGYSRNMALIETVYRALNKYLNNEAYPQNPNISYVSAGITRHNLSLLLKVLDENYELN